MISIIVYLYVINYRLHSRLVSWQVLYKHCDKASFTNNAQIWNIYIKHNNNFKIFYMGIIYLNILFLDIPESSFLIVILRFYMFVPFCIFVDTKTSSNNVTTRNVKMFIFPFFSFSYLMILEFNIANIILCLEFYY